MFGIELVIHYLCTKSFINANFNIMLIRVDDAIKNGIYVDKETTTYADNTNIVNLAILDEGQDSIDTTAEIISRLIKLNDSETEIYKLMINEIKNKQRNQILITYLIDEAIKKYGKTMRAYYKAINNLINKRVISCSAVDYVKVNIYYNFINLQTIPKFVVIRLTDNR